MEFSTPGRASVLFVLLLSCGGNGTASSKGTATTQTDPGGPFVAEGASGPFAALVGATSDFTAKYGNGGPFESQGASGPFSAPGAIAAQCAAACARLESFPCAQPVDNQQRQGDQPAPAGSTGGGQTSNSTSLTRCLQTCAVLDAVQGNCLRNLVGNAIACELTATLSCSRNGSVEAEACGEPQVSLCGGTMTTVVDQPGPNDNGTPTPVTRDAGVR